MKALEHATTETDVWEKFELHELPAERCRRHRYHVEVDEWEVDETLVKMDRKPFDHGAMRECFRMKKLSQQPNRRGVHALDWKKANNYVAKQYVDDETTGKQKALDDVKLQRAAGLLALAFDDLSPPKPVMIIDCFCVELFEREPTEWMLCERFIDGHDAYGRGFTKHNSNAGFVDDGEKRLTPPAFTAATFWLSKGNVMVCDVQGVEDMFTDPCMHSANQSFGGGDLGRRGMALFFQSYDSTLNPLFDLLQMPHFQLSPSERSRCANKIDGTKGISMTSRREELLTVQRRRLETVGVESLDASSVSAKDVDDLKLELDKAEAAATAALARFLNNTNHILFECRKSKKKAGLCNLWPIPNKVRRASSADSATMDDELRHIRIEASPRTTRPLPTIQDEPLLALALADVHSALAELETEGRFTEGVADAGSALFHVSVAASLGSAVAAHALGRWHAGLDGGALLPPSVGSHAAFEEKGLVRNPGASPAFLVLAATRGDVAAAAAAAEAIHHSAAKNRLLTFVLSALEDDDEKDATNKSKPALRIGQSVEADYAGEGFYYAAEIVAVSGDSYTVHYLEDDETETEVPRSRIREAENDGDASSEPSSTEKSKDEETKIKAGDAGGEVPPRHEILSKLADLEENAETAASLMKRAAEDALLSAPALASGYLKKAEIYSSK